MEMYNLITTIGGRKYDIIVKDLSIQSNGSVIHATQIGDFEFETFNDFDTSADDKKLGGYFNVCKPKKIIIIGAHCILSEYHGKPNSNICW